jgi:hypothetical protein
VTELDERRGAPEARSRSGARERGGGEGEADDDQDDEDDGERAGRPVPEQGPLVVGGTRLPGADVGWRAAGVAHRRTVHGARLVEAECGHHGRRHVGQGHVAGAPGGPALRQPRLDAGSGHRRHRELRRPPGRRRRDEDDEVARGIKALEQAGEELVRRGQRRPPGGIGRGPGGERAEGVGPVEVAQLDEHHVGPRAAVERVEHGVGVESHPERRLRVAHEQLRPDRPPGDDTVAVDHGERRLAVRLEQLEVEVEVGLEVGVADDGAGQAGRGEGRAQGTGLGAVQEAVVDPRDGGHPEVTTAAPPTGWPLRRASTAAAGSPSTSSSAPTATPPAPSGTAIRLPAPMVAYACPAVVSAPMVRTLADATAERASRPVSAGGSSSATRSRSGWGS